MLWAPQQKRHRNDGHAAVSWQLFTGGLYTYSSFIFTSFGLTRLHNFIVLLTRGLFSQTLRFTTSSRFWMMVIPSTSPWNYMAWQRPATTRLLFFHGRRLATPPCHLSNWCERPEMTYLMASKSWRSRLAGIRLSSSRARLIPIPPGASDIYCMPSAYSLLPLPVTFDPSTGYGCSSISEIVLRDSWKWISVPLFRLHVIGFLRPVLILCHLCSCHCRRLHFILLKFITRVWFIIAPGLDSSWPQSEWLPFQERLFLADIGNNTG